MLEDDVNRRGLREMLVWAVRWVAADSDAALAPLRDSKGTVVMEPDEIALTLDDAWLPSQGQALIPEKAEAVVAEIDRVFGTISGAEHSDLWTEEAVKSSAIWSRQRSLARTALDLMGEERADAELRFHV